MRKASFIISLFVGGSLFMLSFWLSGARGAEYYVRLADAFTLPAVALLSGYLLSLVSRLGFFDIFSFSLRRLFGILIPRLMPNVSYPEYKASRQRGQSSLSMLAAGLIFLLPALIFTLMSM